MRNMQRRQIILVLFVAVSLSLIHPLLRPVAAQATSSVGPFAGVTIEYSIKGAQPLKDVTPVLDQSLVSECNDERSNQDASVSVYCYVSEFLPSATEVHVTGTITVDAYEPTDACTQDQRQQGCAAWVAEYDNTPYTFSDTTPNWFDPSGGFSHPFDIAIPVPDLQNATENCAKQQKAFCELVRVFIGVGEDAIDGYTNDQAGLFLKIDFGVPGFYVGITGTLTESLGLSIPSAGAFIKAQNTETGQVYNSTGIQNPKAAWDDNSGDFVILCPPGDYTVWAWAPCYFPSDAITGVQVVEEASSSTPVTTITLGNTEIPGLLTEVNVQLDPSLIRANFLVQDATGSPVTGATITLASNHFVWKSSATSDSNGNATIQLEGTLAPSLDTYTLTVTSADGTITATGQMQMTIDYCKNAAGVPPPYITIIDSGTLQELNINNNQIVAQLPPSNPTATTTTNSTGSILFYIATTSTATSQPLSSTAASMTAPLVTVFFMKTTTKASQVTTSNQQPASTANLSLTLGLIVIVAIIALGAFMAKRRRRK